MGVEEVWWKMWREEALLGRVGSGGGAACAEGQARKALCEGLRRHSRCDLVQGDFRGIFSVARRSSCRVAVIPNVLALNLPLA